MSITTRSALALAMLVASSTAEGQAHVGGGPTVRAARVAFFEPRVTPQRMPAIDVTSTRCGSHLKNGVMLGLGMSVAVGVLELTYTIIREPLVRNGSNLSPADPMLIAWGGGAGFIIGLISTERCRRDR